MLTDLILGAIVSVVFVGLGWVSRGVTHARIPIVDPFLYILIGAVLALSMVDGVLSELGVVSRLDILTSDRAVILYILAVSMYLIGQCMCRPDDKLVVWERDNPTHPGHWIHPITHYTHDGQQFLMVQSPGAILRSLMGLRDPLEMDLSRPYYFTDVTAETDVLHASQTKVIPLASSYTTEMHRDKWRFGSRKELDQDGDVIRVPRYLRHSKFTVYTYLMSERVWDRPESFWFEKSAYDDAIDDGAIQRARVTRLEIALKEAKYEGVVDHIADLMVLDIDGPELQHNLTDIIKDAKKRRDGDGPASAQ